MYLSGLLPRPMCSDDDKKLLDFGIGFTNIVERTTRGSANLSRQEIVEGIKEQRISRLLNFDSPSLRGERGGGGVIITSPKSCSVSYYDLKKFRALFQTRGRSAT